MKSITIRELNSNTEKYLNLAYLEHENVLIKHKGRTYKIQPLTPPCQFTIEELKEDVLQAVEDAKAGRGYSTEEVMLLIQIEDLESKKQKLLEKIDSMQLVEMLNIVINEFEINGQKPESLYKDREKIEALLEKKRSFKDNK